jgi:hypothetical protein
MGSIAQARVRSTRDSGVTCQVVNRVAGAAVQPRERRSNALAHTVNSRGAMRTLVVLAVAACNSSNTGAFNVDNVVETTRGEARIEVRRHDVPLRDMPMGRWLAGLPMDGMADVDIALVAPIVGGTTRFSKATGTFAFECRETCTLGDDKTRLSIMMFEGLEFGHLTFDAIEIRGAVADGHAKVTAWKIASPDLALTAAVDVTLDDNLASSKIDGCVRFAPTADLEKRAPKMHAMLSMTGASRDDDGMFSIKLEGTLGEIKRLARPCGVQIRR